MKRGVAMVLLLAVGCSSRATPPVAQGGSAAVVPSTTTDAARAGSGGGSGSDSDSDMLIDPWRRSDQGSTATAGNVALPFSLSIPVAEASGAVPLTFGGQAALLVHGDSGTKGAFVVISQADGAVLGQGQLPLADTSDDIEDITAFDGTFVGLTSAGWVYHWQQLSVAPWFKLVRPPYAIGPVDTSWKLNERGDAPPVGTAMACGKLGINCGRNYEGFCIDPRATVASNETSCIGLAIAKADGHAYCVLNSGGKLVANYQARTAIAKPGALAGCAIGDDGIAWIGSNGFDLNKVYKVTAWQSGLAASVASVGSFGLGFCEAIAVVGSSMFRFSDTMRAPSLASKFALPAGP